MAQVLQKPSIISIVGSTIRIAHPDISDYIRTYILSAFTAADTTLNVYDNNGLTDNDYYISGEVADEKTEENDVNGTVTRGTSITVTNTTKFDHGKDAPITKIFERQVAIYGAATDGGTLTAIVEGANSIGIQWNKSFTEYTVTGTTYAYYVVKFYDGTTYSSASDYILATGLLANSAQVIINEALDMTGEKIEEDDMPKEYLLTAFRACQDEIVNYTDDKGISKDWTFELIDDETSISVTENENKYALSGLTYAMKYPDSKNGILTVRLGTKVLDNIGIDDFDEEMENKIKGVVASAASAGDTTLTLDDTYEFSEEGSVYVTGQSAVVTYDTNTESTGVLSGIPASGAGAITVTTVAVDATVWQSVTPGAPTQYAISNGSIYLILPPDSDWVNYKLKFRYLKQLTRPTELSDTTEVTFYHIMKHFVAAWIEEKKGNDKRADRYMAKFNKELAKQARKDKLYPMEEYEYRNMTIDDESNSTSANN